MNRNFLFACFIVTAARLMAAWILPTFDDAFITFRYSYNLVAGHGLVYNIGEKIMGTTAPLFAIIASIPVMLSLSVPRFFVFFNLLCDLCSLYLLYKYFFKGKTPVFLLFVTLFALDPTLNRIAIGGMEANLFLLSSLSGLVLYLNNKKSYSFVLLTIIYFLRPEAVVLVFVLLCVELYDTRKIPFFYGLLSAFTLAIPLTVIYLYYGHFLPQSVVAKSNNTHMGIVNLVRSIFFPRSFNLFIFPLAMFGFIRSAAKEKIFLLSGLWIATYALAYFIKGPFIWTWYIYSIEFVLVIFASAGLTELLTLLHFDLAGKYKYFYILPVIVLLVWGFVVYRVGRSGVEKNVYAELKNDFNQATIRKDSIFFADDIGALGYFTKGYVYDDQMLVTPQAGKYRTARERIVNVKPDYLFLYTDSIYINMIRKDSLLSKKYTFVKRYSINGEKEIPSDLRKLGTIVYRQDYVLFRRKE